MSCPAREAKTFCWACLAEVRAPHDCPAHREEMKLGKAPESNQIEPDARPTADKEQNR